MSGSIKDRLGEFYNRMKEEFLYKDNGADEYLDIDEERTEEGS